jgi:peptidoglycan/LPS O-acetylase OafA/YrhL
LRRRIRNLEGLFGGHRARRRHREPDALKQDNDRLNVAAHGLRGIASLMVFAAHILGGTAAHVYSADTAYRAAIEPFWNIGTFGVFLFFIISGFVILPSALAHSPADFALRRFLRIYPLFFAMTVIFLVLNLITNREPALNDPLTVGAAFVFANLFTGTEQLTPNAWSLTYEVMFYMLTCAVAYYAIKAPNRFAASVMGALCALFVVVFPKALFFVAGVIIRLLHDRDIRLRGVAAVTFELFAFAGLLAFASIEHRGYQRSEFTDPYAIGTLVFASLYFYAACDRASLTTRLVGHPALFYVGTVSYSLYLVHPYTYLATRLLFEKLGLFTDNNALSVFWFGAVSLVVTIAITHVVYVTLERWPYRRYFHKGVYEKPIAAPESEPVDAKLGKWTQP